MCSRTALVAVVLVTSLPLAIQAHDIYSHLKDAEGKSCCNGLDCQPAPYRLTASGVIMFVNGRWIDVPSDKIQYRAISGDTGETGGGHWCGSGYEVGGYDINVPYVTKCAILPPQSASAQ
jgi:hypothetical protein